MSIPQDLFSALSSLVGSRVYPLAFPLKNIPVWPAIRYTRISNVPDAVVCGDSGDDGADTRVQIDVVALTYGEMDSLRLQVMTAMESFDPPVLLQDATEDFDAETKTYRAIIDYLIYKST